MTEEEHKQRHIDLHQALDELVADWLRHQPIRSGKMFSNTSIMELMEWSAAQTTNPTPVPGTQGDGATASDPGT